MQKQHCQRRKLHCEAAASEVDLSYVQITIYDGVKPGWIKIRMPACTGSQACGRHNDWSKCLYLPKTGPVTPG